MMTEQHSVNDKVTGPLLNYGNSSHIGIQSLHIGERPSHTGEQPLHPVEEPLLAVGEPSPTTEVPLRVVDQESAPVVASSNESPISSQCEEHQAKDRSLDYCSDSHLSPTLSCHSDGEQERHSQDEEKREDQDVQERERQDDEKDKDQDDEEYQTRSEEERKNQDEQKDIRHPHPSRSKSNTYKTPMLAKPSRKFPLGPVEPGRQRMISLMTKHRRQPAIEQVQAKDPGPKDITKKLRGNQSDVFTVPSAVTARRYPSNLFRTVPSGIPHQRSINVEGKVPVTASAKAMCLIDPEDRIGQPNKQRPDPPSSASSDKENRDDQGSQEDSLNSEDSSEYDTSLDSLETFSANGHSLSGRFISSANSTMSQSSVDTVECSRPATIDTTGTASFLNTSRSCVISAPGTRSSTNRNRNGGMERFEEDFSRFAKEVEDGPYEIGLLLRSIDLRTPPVKPADIEGGSRWHFFENWVKRSVDSKCHFYRLPAPWACNNCLELMEVEWAAGARVTIPCVGCWIVVPRNFDPAIHPLPQRGEACGQCRTKTQKRPCSFKDVSASKPERPQTRVIRSTPDVQQPGLAATADYLGNSLEQACSAACEGFRANQNSRTFGVCVATQKWVEQVAPGSKDKQWKRLLDACVRHGQKQGLRC